MLKEKLGIIYIFCIDLEMTKKQHTHTKTVIQIKDYFNVKIIYIS